MTDIQKFVDLEEFQVPDGYTEFNIMGMKMVMPSDTSPEMMDIVVQAMIESGSMRIDGDKLISTGRNAIGEIVGLEIDVDDDGEVIGTEPLSETELQRIIRGE